MKRQRQSEGVAAAPGEDGETELPTVVVTPDDSYLEPGTETVLINWGAHPDGSYAASAGSASVRHNEDGSYSIRDGSGRTIATVSAQDARAIEAQGVSVLEFINSAMGHPDVQAQMAAAGLATMVLVPVAVSGGGLAVGLGLAGLALVGYLIFDGDRRAVQGPAVNVPPPPAPDTPPYTPTPVDGTVPGHGAGPRPDVPNREEYPAMEEDPADYVINVDADIDPVRNYPVRADLERHLANVDGTTRQGWPKGGHNAYEAIEWFEDWENRTGRQYDYHSTNTPGIDEIVVKDPAGNVEFTKTVYDPEIYSDQQMTEMARDAGRSAWDRYQSGDPGDDPRYPNRIYDVEIDGVTFRAYINVTPSGQMLIGNVHPK